MTNPNKLTSGQNFKLYSNFESVRRKLLSDKYTDRLEKPLAFWALPNDRRLPLAFMDRTLSELLATPFGELSATPGVGEKKIYSLVRLLNRATQEHPPESPMGPGAATSDKKDSSSNGRPASGGFNPALVSEAMWEVWRETVRRHDVGHEKLGRLAPSLQSLPTVIWHTPLAFYLDHSLAAMRSLKTHGEKRVRVVLEVFHVVHEMLSGAHSRGHLAIHLAPAFVGKMESWIGGALETSEPPVVHEITKHLTIPTLEQIMVDAGATVHKLAEGRLGLYGGRQSVRQQSRKMGVTRARIYQLLEECAKLMHVRWPEGQCRLMLLHEHLSQRCAEPESLAALQNLRELLYPSKLDEEQDEE